MDRASSPQLEGYLLRSLAATSFVVLLPALVVTLLQLAGHIGSSVLAVMLGATLSIAFATLGRRLWARRPREVVYSDLMLWGYLRRARTERRLAQAKGLLGLEGDPTQLAEHVRGESAVAALESLGAALEARDSYTHGHTQRVARYSHMIAKAMHLSDEQVAKVRTAAAVHDVGKISTPREVINKPGPLTDEEYEIMKRHSIVGAAMAARIDDSEVTAMVRHHHEQLDGSGYPDGLRGEDIPLGARIIAVADTFDAITSARPYRAAQQHGRAMRILREEAGTQLDPHAVEAFLGYYGGRRAVAWWSVFAAAPQKIAAGIGGLLHTTGAASITQGVAAVGAAAAIAGGASDAARKHERDPHRAARTVSALTQAVAYSAPSGGTAAPELPYIPLEAQPALEPSGPNDGSGRGAGKDPGAPGKHADAKPGGEAAAAPPAGNGKDDSGGLSPGQAKKSPDPTLAEPDKPGNGGQKPKQTDPAPEPTPDPAPAPTGNGNGNGGNGNGNGGTPPGQSKPKK